MKKITAILLILMTLISSVPALSLKTEAAFAGEDKVTVVLDPGHGGGNIGTGKLKSREIPLLSFYLALRRSFGESER